MTIKKLFLTEHSENTIYRSLNHWKEFCNLLLRICVSIFHEHIQPRSLMYQTSKGICPDWRPQGAKKWRVHWQRARKTSRKIIHGKSRRTERSVGLTASDRFCQLSISHHTWLHFTSADLGILTPYIIKYTIRITESSTGVWGGQPKHCPCHKKIVPHLIYILPRLSWCNRKRTQNLCAACCNLGPTSHYN